MTFSASRLTCYALLSAIEEDIRAAISEAAALGAPAELRPPPAVLDDALRRMGISGEAGLGATISEILPFVDFGETLSLAARNKSRLDANFWSSMQPWFEHLEALLAVRNRVAHTRPLEINDLPMVEDVARALAKSPRSWPTVADVLRRIQANPSYVLDLDIVFRDVEPEANRHNLPLPDFDETGLVGRAAVEKKLQGMLKGPYPVISVVGDGGVGKTSLALKVAYGILDDPSRPFDAVVWTSAKAAQLTNREVVRIEGAIKDSLGLLDSAIRQLAGEISVEDPLEEVIEYMSMFRVLLILDNLETVLDARLKEFLARLPRDSKVLITSRIGLGSLELPLKLDSLETRDAVVLLRAVARSRGIASLAKADQVILERLVNRMHNHPLYLKWFVSVTQAGMRAEDVFADSGDFLDFCMSNVYEFLGEDAKVALRALQVLPGQQSQATIAAIALLPVEQLQPALAQLITTNFVNLQPVARGGSISSEYEITEFARKYLDRRHPLPEVARTDMQRRYQELIAQGARLATASAADPYSEQSLSVSGPADFSVASRLHNAMALGRRGEHGDALSMVREAQLLAPDYFETYRVEAMLLDRSGDLSQATEAYSKALEHGEGNAQCSYHAGRFFLTRGGDPGRGLALLQEAARVRRDDMTLKAHVLRAHFQCGNMEEAFDGALGLIDSAEEGVPADVAEVAFAAGMKTISNAIAGGDAHRALEYCDSVINTVLPALSATDSLVEIRFAQMRGMLSRIEPLLTDVYIGGVHAALVRGVEERGAVSEGLGYALVARVNHEKGFGFLRVPGQQDLFFGRRVVSPNSSFAQIRSGHAVAFEPGVDKDGRSCAVKVILLEDYAYDA